ncbi:hypothetical protein ml_439 [Mollivirus sibericum]|uniref:hypothetical protein n=1 Tax=Mollivirus sibericum TaxID=1678078 RepID=UPI0006B2EB03|nr:hypothetical protein ml_439 [Mollivirus sibericum]ALD62241.1 hypothetical protein ml_439 [Mollivirus sibericum]
MSNRASSQQQQQLSQRSASSAAGSEGGSRTHPYVLTQIHLMNEDADPETGFRDIVAYAVTPDHYGASAMAQVARKNTSATRPDIAAKQFFRMLGNNIPLYESYYITVQNEDSGRSSSYFVYRREDDSPSGSKVHSESASPSALSRRQSDQGAQASAYQRPAPAASSSSAAGRGRGSSSRARGSSLGASSARQAQPQRQVSQAQPQQPQSQYRQPTPGYVPYGLINSQRQQPQYQSAGRGQSAGQAQVFYAQEEQFDEFGEPVYEDEQFGYFDQ